MQKKLLLILLFIAGIFLPSCSHANTGLQEKPTGIPDQFFKKVSPKNDNLKTWIEKQTRKCLVRIVHREKKFKRKLVKEELAAPPTLFVNSEQQYTGVVGRTVIGSPFTIGRQKICLRKKEGRSCGRVRLHYRV